jgi:hypothetical protein
VICWQRQRSSRAALAALTALAAGGCVDLRDFKGNWSGEIVDEPAIRAGFEATARVEALQLDEVTQPSVTARLTTNDGTFANTALVHVTKSTADALATLTFDGNPLQTYLLFAPLANSAGDDALLVLSLYGDDHLELRVIRSNDLFGVFYLERK